MSGGIIKLGSKPSKNLHYMQTELWADVRRGAGWKHHKLSLEDHTILVYYRLVPSLGYLYYIPQLEGISLANIDKLTALLKLNCKKGFAIRLELDQPKEDKLLEAFVSLGWKTSRKHMQYRHTVTIDLKPSAKDIWMSLKSRGRYEVLQAEKAGFRRTADKYLAL